MSRRHRVKTADGGSEDDSNTSTQTSNIILSNGVWMDTNADQPLAYSPNTINIQEEVPLGWACHKFTVDEKGSVTYESGYQRVKSVLLLLLVVCIVVVTSTLDTVVLTRMTKSLLNVTILLTEGIYPFLFCLFIWIPIGVRTIVRRTCACQARATSYEEYADSSDDSATEMKSKSDDSGKPVRKPKAGLCDFLTRDYMKMMTIMAAMDTLSSLLIIPALIYLNPILVMMLNLSTYLPINMVIASMYGGKRYHTSHYLGAATLLLAVVIVFLGIISDRGAIMLPTWRDVFWIFLLILSKIPSSFGSNYKEWHLKKKNLDVWCTTAWIATIQWLMSVPMFFLILSPIPETVSEQVNSTVPASWTEWGDADLNNTFVTLPYLVNVTTLKTETILTYPINVNNLGSYLSFSMQCIFGDFLSFYPEVVSPANYTVGSIPANVFDSRGIQCSGVGYQLFFFMFVNVTYNVTITDILKLTTSNITAMVSVLVLIVTNFAFGIPWLAGVAYQRPRMWDFVALVAAALGIASFWSMPEVVPKEILQELSSGGGADAETDKGKPPDPQGGCCRDCLRNCFKSRQFIAIQQMALSGEDT